MVDDTLDMNAKPTTARAYTRGNKAEIDNGAEFLSKNESSQNGIDNTLGGKDLTSKEIFSQNETYVEELFNMTNEVAKTDDVAYTLQHPKMTEEGGVLLKMNFLIYQPKHMLWVLKRTVLMRRFF